MACKSIKRRKRTVCIGDMREKITLQTRSIKPSATGGADFTESFTADKVVWAMVETRQGAEIFDSTNILVGVATHYFYIRYMPDITFEKWLTHKSKYYDILDVQNLEERDEFYLLKCSIRGTTSNTANYA